MGPFCGEPDRVIAYARHVRAALSVFENCRAVFGFGPLGRHCLLRSLVAGAVMLDIAMEYVLVSGTMVAGTISVPWATDVYVACGAS